MLELLLNRIELKEVILETVCRDNLRHTYIRAVGSRGVGPLGLDPTKCPKETVVIIVDEKIRHLKDIDQTPASESGTKAVTVATRWNSPDVLSPRVKSTNYLNNILPKLQTHAAGEQEAICLNAQGFVCELTGDNLSVVKNARLTTPPGWTAVLDEVTRRAILRTAREQGIETTEEPLTMLYE